MEYFTQSARRIFISIGLLTIVAALSWWLTPQKPVFAGIFLGLTVSLYNASLLFKKTKQVGEMAIGQRKRMMGIGTLQRFLMAGFAVYVALKLPGTFHPMGVIAGLIASQVISFALTSFDLIFSKIK